MIELIINGIVADLPIDFSPQLKKSYLDISNPVSRFATISYNLNLPKTSNNKRVFENIILKDRVGKFFQWDKTDPTQPNRYQASLSINGNDILRGWFYLDEIGDSYTGNLVDNSLSQWFDLLTKDSKDITLPQLNLLYDRLWEDNIEEFDYAGGSFLMQKNTWDNLNERINPNNIDWKGIVFPYIHYYNKNYEFVEEPTDYILGDDHTYEDMLPALFIKDILTCIVASTGYSLSISEDIAIQLKDLVIPYNKAQEYNWGLGKENALAWVRLTNEPTVTFENKAGLCNLIFSGWATYLASKSGVLQIAVRAKHFNGTTLDYPLSGKIGKWTGESLSDEDPISLALWSAIDEIQYLYYEVEKGDRVTIQVDYDPLIDYPVFSYLEIYYVEKIEESEEYKDWGKWIPWLYNLPDITCKDFLKNICTLFGGYIYADNVSKQLNIISIKDQLNRVQLAGSPLPLTVLSKSYRLNPLNQWKWDYSNDVEDVYNVPKVNNTNDTISLFAPTYLRPYTFLKQLSFDTLKLDIPVIINKENVLKDALKVVWDEWVIYDKWEAGETYPIGTIVKADVPFSWVGPIYYEFPSIRFYKAKTNILIAVDPPNIDPTNWEELDLQPYEFVNPTFDQDFIPRILRIVPITTTVSSMFLNNTTGSIRYSWGYSQYNYLSQEFQSDLVQSWLQVSKADFPESLTSEYLLKKNWNSLSGIFSKNSHQIQFDAYIPPSQWILLQNGIPLVLIDDALHLITEISQWNTRTYKAKGTAIRWTI